MNGPRLEEPQLQPEAEGVAADQPAGRGAGVPDRLRPTPERAAAAARLMGAPASPQAVAVRMAAAKARHAGYASRSPLDPTAGRPGYADVASRAPIHRPRLLAVPPKPAPDAVLWAQPLIPDEYGALDAEDIADDEVKGAPCSGAPAPLGEAEVVEEPKYDPPPARPKPRATAPTATAPTATAPTATAPTAKPAVETPPVETPPVDQREPEREPEVVREAPRMTVEDGEAMARLAALRPDRAPRPARIHLLTRTAERPAPSAPAPAPAPSAPALATVAKPAPRLASGTALAAAVALPVEEPDQETAAKPSGDKNAERPSHLHVVERNALSPAQRRRRTRAFLIAGIGMATSVALALVYLHVVLAQRQFAIDRLDANVAKAQTSYQNLRLQVAQLGAPSHIIATAEGQIGMVPPTKVVYLSPTGSVPTPAPGTPTTVTGGSTATTLATGRGDAAAVVPPDQAPAGDADWPVIKSQLAGQP